MAKKTAFFLGANTPKGFVSFFDELYNPYESTDAYIIKGGPGSGKSTFMKHIAEAFTEKDTDTEWIYCSSDPDSLDGLIVSEKDFSIADGTSPHVLEPKFPGCSENILNLGQFWNELVLKGSADKIRSLFVETSLYHRRSSRYLAAAGSLDNENRKIVSSDINRDKLDGFATRFLMRELPKVKGRAPGRKSRRFLSGITPKGNIFFKNTVYTLCPRVLGVNDKDGVVSSLLCQRIADGAVKNGYDVICCHCPMHPDECEHVLIPEKGLAVIRLHEAAADTDCSRVIHTKRFLCGKPDIDRSLITLNSKLKAELIKESVKSLKKSKTTHDELEKIYIHAMDFGRLGRFCEEFINRNV